MVWCSIFFCGFSLFPLFINFFNSSLIKLHEYLESRTSRWSSQANQFEDRIKTQKRRLSLWGSLTDERHTHCPSFLSDVALDSFLQPAGPLTEGWGQLARRLAALKELEGREGEQTDLIGNVWRLQQLSAADRKEHNGKRVKLGWNAEGPGSLDSFPQRNVRRERLQAADQCLLADLTRWVEGAGQMTR